MFKKKKKLTDFLGCTFFHDLFTLIPSRALHSHHGICQLWHIKDLPADPKGSPDFRPRVAKPPHHRLLPHCFGCAAFTFENGNAYVELTLKVLKALKHFLRLSCYLLADCTL